MKRPVRFFLLGLWAAGAVTAATGPFAPKPLFRDPVYDGAADPVVIWNPQKQAWWMFYTNRRANIPGLSGVAWVHGTRIGIAESTDGGAKWSYAGTITPQDKDALVLRRSSIQVVELIEKDGRLTCDRDTPTRIILVPPVSGK